MNLKSYINQNPNDTGAQKILNQYYAIVNTRALIGEWEVRLLDSFLERGNPSSQDKGAKQCIEQNFKNQLVVAKQSTNFKDHDYSTPFGSEVQSFESEYNRFENALNEYQQAKREKEFLYSHANEEKGEEFILSIHEHLASHIVLKEHKLRYQEEQNGRYRESLLEVGDGRGLTLEQFSEKYATYLNY